MKKNLKGHIIFFHDEYHKLRPLRVLSAHFEEISPPTPTHGCLWGASPPGYILSYFYKTCHCSAILSIYLMLFQFPAMDEPLPTALPLYCGMSAGPPSVSMLLSSCTIQTISWWRLRVRSLFLIRFYPPLPHVSFSGPLMLYESAPA